MFSANQLVDRLCLCGLNRSEATQVVNLVDVWIRKSGLEWTIGHLKAIKQTILSLYGNNPNGVSPYIRTRNSLLSGPFRAVQRLMISGNDKALSALLLYTSWVSQSLTKSQAEKFTKACTAEPYSGSFEPSYKVWNKFGWKLPNFTSKSLPFGGDKDWTFAPDNKGRSFQANDHKKSAESFIDLQVYRDLYYANAEYYPEDWDYLSESVLGVVYPKPSGSAPVGKVSVIQEPGLKARFIANPNRVVQHLLKPFGDHLFKVLRELPWDCTFDQSKPLDVIQQHVKNGQVAYCYDLSNATDYFPLEIQMSYCDILFSNDPRWHEICVFLRLFGRVARSQWFFGDKTIQWTRGQPLGLYPSFALFAISHGMILLECLYNARRKYWVQMMESVWNKRNFKKFPHELTAGPDLSDENFDNWLLTNGLYHGEFYVLGDDVIILNDNLAVEYLTCCQELGVPVNKSKSQVSEKLAEFAGHVILENHIYMPFKWRLVNWDSVVPFLKHWGVEGINLLPRHLKEWAVLISRLPEPIGLGYNPEGIPLGVRIAALLELYLDETLPALTEVKECLSDVLKALPSRSSISYYTTPAMERPVPLPLFRLVSYLNNEDLRDFLKHLIHKGVIHKYEALEIAGSMNFVVSSEEPAERVSEHRATALVQKQKMFYGVDEKSKPLSILRKLFPIDDS
jgi:hypothetical protein